MIIMEENCHHYILGQSVIVKAKAKPQIHGSEWKSGNVLVVSCSYIVEVYGLQYCKNRIHFRDSQDTIINPLPEVDLSMLDNNDYREVQ